MNGAAAPSAVLYRFTHDELDAWVRATGPDPRLFASDRLTAYAARLYVNRRTGRVWASAATLARETGQDAGRCRHALRNLVAAGYLVVITERPGRSTVYGVSLSTTRAPRCAGTEREGAHPDARARATRCAGGAHPGAREPVREPVENRPDDSPIPAWVAARWADRLGDAR